VLVTGGTGFLGANLIHHLVTEKGVPRESVRTLSHRASRALDALPGVELVTGDILDSRVVTDACRDRTIVFHTAGSTTFDPRLKKQQWLVNVEGTRNVLEAVRASRTVRRLCHTSTVNVLGCPSPRGAIGTEAGCDPYASRPRLHSFASPGEALGFADAVHSGTAPRGWWRRIGIGYHDSKLAAQELVNRAVREQGLDVVSVLPGTSFGAFDEFIGPGLFLLGVYHNRLSCVTPGGLPLAHARDVARGHALAMEKGRAGQEYILGGREEDNRTLLDMARIIAAVLREREPRRAIGARFTVVPGTIALIAAAVLEAYAALSGRPAAITTAAVRASRFPCFYSSAKAERELGYRAEGTFAEAIGVMYDYLKRRGLLERQGAQR
jgi:dihydroflavonol-4-reductase